MKLLALDTSSLACTVGVINGEQSVLRYEEQPREHTRLLMPMIRSALKEAKLELQQLDAIVLGNGPGSFIGMRIAASVAQGLAFGAELNIVPVSSMAVVAAGAVETGIVVVAQDAHMQEVYLGIYEVTATRAPVPVIAERLQTSDAIAELAGLSNVTAAGAGWQRYPDLLASNNGFIESRSDCLYPSAEQLLRLGRSAYQAGEAVPPEAVDPAYLRHKVAEKPKSAAP